MKKRMRVITFLIGIVMMLTNSVSFGTGPTSNPQIKTRNLVFSTGKSSDQIRMLKDYFRAKGEPNVPWGYEYDNRTRELVRNFQRQVGLDADGIAGKSTIDRINKDIRENNIQVGLRVPHVNVSGSLILINKSSNTLYLLRDGVVQDSYPVATGKASGLTPTGQFRIVNKLINPAWGGAGISPGIAGGHPSNPLGKRWMGINFGGGGKYGVHGNANASSIGSYASLGCVRMFNPDSEKLFDQITTNIPIWIGTEDKLESYGVKFKSNYIAKKVEEVPPLMPVNLNINGENIVLKDSLIIKEGTTYYPFREILELINAEVFWDSENKVAKGVLGENVVEFQLDNNEYKNNDNYKFLPGGQKIFIDKDRTYVPIRNLMEGLGFEVTWEDATRTIIVKEILVEEDMEELIEEDLLEEEILDDGNQVDEEVLEDENIDEDSSDEIIKDEKEEKTIEDKEIEENIEEENIRV